MKNKKLLKTVLCITSGIGFATSIPFIATSCGSSSVKLNPLPDEVYDIENNVLKGFKSDIDLSKYRRICDTMEIPASVIGIDHYAFFDGEKTKIPSYVKNLTFADGSNCSSIGEFAFSDCFSITSTSLPNSLELIADSAFCECAAFTSIDLSNCTKLSSIGYQAFYRCASLTSVTFPNSLNSIGDFAFFQCSSLTSITFPNSLNSIAQFAFYECAKLASITFPNSLNSIGQFAFNRSESLNYIAWDLPNQYSSNINIDTNAFDDISPTGTVRSLNTLVASSEQLLTWIKTKGDFPSSGWTYID